MDLNNKYSILVNTCDKYRDAWPMFFYLLKQNWHSEMPNVYLNTEKDSYYDDEISIKVLNHEKSKEWGGRLIECLNDISDDYVLMMLEDFYYENTIKSDVIERCIKDMMADPQIMAFQMVPCGEVDLNPENITESDYSGFALRKRCGLYTLAACPTLWRKSDLIRITREDDTPWDWEFFGSRRTWLYNKKIYSWISKTNCIFSYDIDHGGAIHRGKWVGYKMKELQEKYNYSLDYGDRQIEEDWMKDDKRDSTPPFYRRLPSVVCNRSRVIVEIIRGYILGRQR